MVMSLPIGEPFIEARLRGCSVLKLLFEQFDIQGAIGM